MEPLQDDLDFQWVVGRIRSLNGLILPSPKASRIAPPAVDDLVGEHPTLSTSFALPRSKMLSSLIEDTNAVLALDRGCFLEAKKKSLLPPPKVRDRRYYLEQGCSGFPAHLNSSMTDLLKSSFDRAAAKDVSFSVAEVKELEGSLCSSRAISSWLDLWLNAFRRFTMDPKADDTSVKRLLKSGSKALSFLAQQLNHVCFNLRLKRRDAVLESLSSGCTPEEISALRNSIDDGSDNLFPEDVVREVSEKHHSRVEKAALRKAISSSSGSKRKASPSGTSTGSGRQAKTQKPPAQVAVPPSTKSSGKDSKQSFPKTPDRGKGKQKQRNKKRGGAN